MSHSCRMLVVEKIHHLLHESGPGRGLAGECGLVMIDISYVPWSTLLLVFYFVYRRIGNCLPASNFSHEKLHRDFYDSSGKVEIVASVMSPISKEF